MDRATLEAYEQNAASFPCDWESQPAPDDIYDIIRRFFRQEKTADIGCGSGRDTAWLTQNGFAATGYDASEGLLTEARRRHPDIQFHPATLPELSGIAEENFTNVFCETVIMHLPREAIAASVARLMAILKPEGTLYLSWRVTEGHDKRDERGRLYAAFDAGLVLQALTAWKILLDEQRVSISSGKTVRRIVTRKV
jgi:2-polyprenyl-3-methyl-5-hydroxy-6-metoxy-1,4-benzoquinol methylase